MNITLISDCRKMEWVLLLISNIESILGKTDLTKLQLRLKFYQQFSRSCVYHYDCENIFLINKEKTKA